MVHNDNEPFKIGYWLNDFCDKSCSVFIFCVAINSIK